MDINIDEVRNDIIRLTLDEQYLLDILNYFNTTPTKDIDYYPLASNFCDKHRNKTVCYKCLLDHDETHKCYVYDRIFIATYFREYYWRFDNYNIKTAYRDTFEQYDYYHDISLNKRYCYIMFDGGCAGEVTNTFHIGRTSFTKCWSCNYCYCY